MPSQSMAGALGLTGEITRIQIEEDNPAGILTLTGAVAVLVGVGGRSFGGSLGLSGELAGEVTDRACFPTEFTCLDAIDTTADCIGVCDENVVVEPPGECPDCPECPEVIPCDECEECPECPDCPPCPGDCVDEDAILTRPIALETFTGADTGDIVLRTPDGGGDTDLAKGKFAYAYAGTGLIGIESEKGVNVFDTDYASYQLRGIPLLPAKVGSRLKARVLETNQGDTALIYAFVTEHDFSTTSNTGDIDGMVLNGGPGTFTRMNGIGVDTGAIGVLSGHAEINGILAAAGTYGIAGLSIGKNYAMRVTGHSLGTLEAQGWQAWVRLVPVGGGSLNPRGYATELSNNNDSGELSIQLQINLQLGSIDGYDAVFTPALDPGDSVTTEVAALTCPGAVTTCVISKYNGSIPDSIDAEGSVPLIKETNILNDEVGIPGFTVGQNTGITKVQVYEVSTNDCPCGGDKLVLFETSLCEDFDIYQAYRLEGRYDSAVGDVPTVTIRLQGYTRSGDGNTHKTRLTAAYGPVEYPTNDQLVLQLDYDVRSDGTRVLHGYLNGTEIATFDVVNDAPDEVGVGHPVTMPDYAGSGNPGLAFQEDSIFTPSAPRQAVLDEYAVLACE